MFHKHTHSMTARLAGAVLAVLGILSPARATLVSSKFQVVPGRNLSHETVRDSALRRVTESAPEHVKDSPTPAPKQEFRITEQTEIRLDGRPCQYKEVPNDAVIILLEVDSEQNKAILKMHFRSKK